ncbi:ATP-binding protein [Streptomyces sp. PA03-1a]|nr:ATP-binding protein [Streptomyces sp. PA03-1a]MDX2811991.1 ATP-binding protein [Streptomyces sp. PA03-5A]
MTHQERRIGFGRYVVLRASDTRSLGGVVQEPLSHSPATEVAAFGFEVAVADLVDNSIDAESKDVVIHIPRDGGQLVSQLVIDEGKGTSEEDLDIARTVGGRPGAELRMSRPKPPTRRSGGRRSGR